MKKQVKIFICALTLTVCTAACSATGISFQDINESIQSLTETVKTIFDNEISFDIISNEISDDTSLPDPVNFGDEYIFDETFYPYRTYLSDAGQSVYNQIYANAVARNETFTLSTELSTDEIYDVIIAVMFDHPELYWLDTSFEYSYNDSGIVKSVTLTFNDLAYDEVAEAAFLAAAQEYIDGASQYSTVLEKEQYIHDALCSNITYTLDSEYNQSAYSGMVTGETVCAGYAKAFQYLMIQLGIPCYYVTGTVDEESHAWNLVMIDGALYNVDLTWDDAVSEAYHTNAYSYFNLTDEQISIDHTRDEYGSKLPSSGTSTAYQLQTVSGISSDEVQKDERLDHMQRDMPSQNPNNASQPQGFEQSGPSMEEGNHPPGSSH